MPPRPISQILMIRLKHPSTRRYRYPHHHLILLCSTLFELLLSNMAMNLHYSQIIIEISKIIFIKHPLQTSKLTLSIRSNTRVLLKVVKLSFPITYEQTYFFIFQNLALMDRNISLVYFVFHFCNSFNVIS